MRAQSSLQDASDLSFFSEQPPSSSPSPPEPCVGWGVGQVEMREVALRIHRQDRVLLSCVPFGGTAPTWPGHGPLWLWEPADWQWGGLTWAPALLWMQPGGAAQCFVTARGSHGSLGTEHHPAKMLAGRETGEGRPHYLEPSFLQVGSELWQVSQAVKPGIPALSSASHNPSCLGQGGKGLGKPSQPNFCRSPEARGRGRGL